MRHCLFAFCILLFTSNHISAQSSNFDSLKSAIENAASPEEKAENMNNLAERLIEKQYFADAAVYVTEAIQIAKSTNNQAQLARALDNRGQILNGKFDYSNAMQCFVEALKIKSNLADKHGAANSRYLIGKTLLLQGDFENAKPKLDEALLAFKEQGNKSGEARAYRSLGDVALGKKILGEARNQYSFATEASIESGNLSEAANLSNDLGEIAIQMGDWEGALVYFHQSFDLHSSTGDMKNMSNDYLNIGQALLHKGETNEAISAFETANSISQENQDTFGLAKGMVALGTALKSTNTRKSTQAFEAAIIALQSVKPCPGMPELYAEASDFFKEKGKMTKAHQALSLHISSKEALFSLEKNKAMLDLSTRYESQIAEAQQQQTIQQLELNEATSSKIRFALLGILAFAMAFLWMLFKKNQSKKRDNAILQVKNNEIDHKNKELAEKHSRLDLLNTKLVNEIAEREMAEKAALDKDKQIFSLSLSMQEPLRKIQHIARDMQIADIKAKHKDSVVELQYRANDLLVLINDLLENNQIEAGKLNAESVEFDPAEIVNKINSDYGSIFGHRNVPFAIEYESTIPASLYGNPEQFSHIIGNLLNHSIEKTLPESARVKVSHDNDTVDSITLHTEIVTTYREEDAAKLYAADQASVTIAKRLTDIQNGRFETLCQTPQKLSYSIHLPYKKSSPAGARPSINLNVAGQHLEGRSILLIEDNKINQMVVAKLLEKYGASVLVAENGREGLDFIASNPRFDLILMDIQMPELDGYRATAEIRKLEDVEKSEMPIIALTASAYLTDKDKANLFQMDDHIGKPFSPEELLQKVIEVITV